MFLWRSLRPDAVTVLLRYLASRNAAAKPADAAAARPPAAAKPEAARRG